MSAQQQKGHRTRRTRREPMKQTISMTDIVRQVEATRVRVAGIAVSPCPFCGQSAELRRTRNRWYVDCDPVCGACGPAADTPEQAAQRWNARGESQELQEVYEQLIHTANALAAYRIMVVATLRQIADAVAADEQEVP